MIGRIEGDSQRGMKPRNTMRMRAYIRMKKPAPIEIVVQEYGSFMSPPGKTRVLNRIIGGAGRTQGVISAPFTPAAWGFMLR
jgi:hypothetical protein